MILTFMNYKESTQIILKTALLTFAIGMPIVVLIYMANAYTCKMIEGTVFQSDYEFTLDNPIMKGTFHPTITFQKNRTLVMGPSDVAIETPYECTLGWIWMDRGWYEGPIGQFNPFTGVLLWGGETYKKVLLPN